MKQYLDLMRHVEQHGVRMISLIAAIAENGVIGVDNQLPWHLPADLAFFQNITSGHTVILGRKTFESFSGEPLPNRRNIVITSNPRYGADGIEVFEDLSAALKATTEDEQVFICGGVRLYEEALPMVDQMYLTRVAATPVGDAVFPEVNWDDWRLVSERRLPADENNAHSLTFQRYEQRQPSRD